MNADERYLTIEEAAARLRMNAEVLRRMCKQGRFPAAQIGRLWRIRQSDIDAMFTRRASP